MRPAPEADGSAVLLVPNVKVRMETQHYIPPPLMICYGKDLPLPLPTKY